MYCLVILLSKNKKEKKKVFYVFSFFIGRNKSLSSFELNPKNKYKSIREMYLNDKNKKCNAKITCEVFFYRIYRLAERAIFLT